MEKPICPNCNTAMEIVKYEGYYEDFIFWECECPDEILEKNIDRRYRGAYS